MKLQYVLLAIFLLSALSGFSQQRRNAAYVELVENNDFLLTRFNTDRYYTNHSEVNLYLPKEWLLSGFLNYFLVSTGDKTTYNTHKYSLGTEMYTPDDLVKTDLDVLDRPYAGYTYVGFTNYSAALDDQIIMKSGLRFGTLGPRARADELQISFHERIGSVIPRGWDNQIKNEWVFFDLNTTIEKGVFGPYLKRPTNYMDWIPSMSLRLGQVVNQMTIGSIVKLGWFNDHFSNPMGVWEPNYKYTNPGDLESDQLIKTGQSTKAYLRHNRRLRYRNFQLYFYFNPGVTAVASNSFLQGGLLMHLQKDFEGVHIIASDDLNRLIYEMNSGIFFNYGGLSIDFSTNYRSAEFRTALPHQWARIRVMFRIS